VTPKAPTVAAYAGELSRLRGVGRIDVATGSYIAGTRVAGRTRLRRDSPHPVGASRTWFSAVPTVEPQSSRGETLVKTIRHGFPTRGLDAPACGHL
jgi:RND superfamily putative drug exporter